MKCAGHSPMARYMGTKFNLDFLTPPFLSPSEIEIIFADSRDVFFKPKDDFFSNSRDVFFEPPRWKVAD